MDNLAFTTRLSVLALLGDTLQELFDSKSSSLGNVLGNITSILENLPGLKDISSTVQSLRSIV